jgi:hypothetical protein
MKILVTMVTEPWFMGHPKGGSRDVTTTVLDLQTCYSNGPADVEIIEQVTRHIRKVTPSGQSILSVTHCVLP